MAIDQEFAEQAIATCLNAHYHLMRSKRYWYDAADRAASTLLCVAASDLRAQLKASE